MTSSFGRGCVVAMCLVAAVATASGCAIGTEEEVAGSEGALKGGCHWSCPRCPAHQVCSLRPCVLICNANDPQQCGDHRCAAGDYCCNPSCGTCAPMGALCTQQVCSAPTTGGCTSDADCRLFSDYCTGCNCDALTVGEPDPYCDGTGVSCFADPCGGHTASCDLATGACVVN